MADRNRAWADTILTGQALADKVSTHFDLLANSPVVDTLTAVRIILDVKVYHGVDEVADHSAIIHLGIGVASVEAFAAGTTSLPAPADSTAYPPRGWLYVASKPTGARNTTGIVVADFQADLRAMRKIDKGILFMCIQQVGVLGSSAVDLWGRVRVLCLT